MSQSLREQQTQQGAIIQATLDYDFIATFGQDTDALSAAEIGVALWDRSHWGRIEMTDRDRKSFLHHQSSNDIQRLNPGQGCETVILTSTARTIDLVDVYCTEASLLLLTSPNRRQKLMEWFDRYIFFNDKVVLRDQTENLGCFSLIGPESGTLLAKLGCSDLPQEGRSHQTVSLKGQELRIAKGSGLVSDGYTLIFQVSDGLDLWQALTGVGAIPLGENAWETLRVQQGRPKTDAELTEDFNPLEAGLWHTVSFDKGCYIGQETIARLNTYDGVKQKLWGFELSQSVAAGSPITLADKKVGVITSVLDQGTSALALGYVKSKAGGAGLTVMVGACETTVKELPYLNRPITD